MVPPTGVGLAAVQFAVGGGVTVIGTASDKNHEYLRSLGVIPTTYGEGLVDRVRELAPQGVDVALDTVGSGVLPDLIRLTGSADKVITIADSDAARYGVGFASGGGGAARRKHVPKPRSCSRGESSGLPVAETFTLENIAAAHAKSEQGHGLGKYIVRVS